MTDGINKPKSHNRGAGERLYKRRLTPKQRNFIKNYVALTLNNNPHPGINAARLSYNTSNRKCASAMSNQNLNNPLISSVIEAALEKYGITIDEMALRIRGALDATSPVVYQGEITDNYPDHATRLKAVDMGFKLRGAYPDEKSVDKRHLHQHVHVQEPPEVTRFICLHGRRPTNNELQDLLGDRYRDAIEVKSEKDETPG